MKKVKKKKKWGLEVKTHKKFIQDRIETDYRKKLNKHELKYLNSFNLAVAEGRFKPLEQLGVEIPKKTKTEMNSERYKAELCSGPNNSKARFLQRQEVQSLKWKMSMAKEMLEGVPGIDMDYALAELKDFFSGKIRF